MHQNSYFPEAAVGKLQVYDDFTLNGKSLNGSQYFEDTQDQVLLSKDLHSNSDISTDRGMYAGTVGNSPDSVITRNYVNQFMVSKDELVSVQSGGGILNGIGSLTNAEVSQLANIDNASIPNSAWQNVGKLNQDVSSTANPTFFKVSVNNAPSVNSDLANKGYVDSYIASTKMDIDGSIIALHDIVDTKAASGTSYTKSETDNKLSGYQPKNSNLALIDQSLNTNSDVFFNSLKTNKVPSDSRDVATKSYVDNGLASKTDLLTTNTKADKAEVYVRNQLYTKTETDSLLSSKVSQTLYDTKTAQLDASIAARVLQSEYNTKTGQLDTAIAGKVEKTLYDSSKEATDTAIGQRALISSVYTKSQVDSAVGLKHDTSAFNSYQVSAQNDINSRLPSATFDSFVTSNTANIATKVPRTEYDSFVSNTNTSLNNKQPLSANLTSINQNLGVANSPTFAQVFVNSAPSTNISLVNKAYADAISTNINNYKLSNDSVLATKLNSSIFDAYKVSNDALVQDRITNAFFQQYDTQLTSNLSNLQQQVSQRLLITAFDTFRNANNQQIASKQDANPYLTGINQELMTTSSPSFTGVTVNAAPTSGDSLVNKTYVDASQSSLTAGTGLTRTTNTFSVNAEQPGITSLGALSSLNVTGTATFAQPLVLPIGDALRFTRASGSQGQMLIGSDPVSNEIFNFKHLGGSGEMLFTTTTNGKVTFNTNTLHILATNDATSPTVGSVRIAGGVSIAKNLHVGTDFQISNTAGGSRVKLHTANNAFWIGAVQGDLAGEFHVYSFTDNSRILGWHRTDNSIRLGFWNNTTAVQCTGTMDSTTSATGSLQVLGGAGIAKNLNVGANLNVTGTSTLSSVNISSTLTSTGITNSGTITSGLFYSTTGQYDMAQPSFGTVATVSASGNGNTAQMNLIVNGGQTNTSMWKFYRSGNPANPLATISGVDGAFKAGNYDASIMQGTTGQSGVTFTKTTDNSNFARKGKIVDIILQFVISSFTGTQSGPLTWSLPSPSAVTCTIDSGYYIFRNGAQITNMRIALTAGLSVAYVQLNNGFGTFQNFATTQTENLLVSFSYLSQ